MRLAWSMPIPILLAAALGTAATAHRPATSWGKAGISYADYRADATACLREAAGTDLAGTEPAEALVLATRRIETGLTRDMTPMVNAGPPAFNPVLEAEMRVSTARVSARPDLRIRQARAILQAQLDRCLQARGYRRFALTADQSRRLNHFSLRRPERQVYLHSLAADPQVLASQTIVGIEPSPRGR